MNVELDNLGKRFGSRSGTPIVALENVSASIASGEFVALLGPSGCGKSTLLDLVAGLQTPTSGAVRMGDGNAAIKPAMIFQRPVLLPWRTTIENVYLPAETGAQPAERQGKARYRERASELLRLVGLERFENQLPSELSGGMQQRVALARALLLESPILCMDEPFSALDDFTREQMHLELLRIWEDKRFTVLFVTHNIFEAVFLADRVLVMTPGPGKVVADIRVGLERPRSRDIIGSEAFAFEVKRVRDSMATYWTSREALQ